MTRDRLQRQMEMLAWLYDKPGGLTEADHLKELTIMGDWKDEDYKTFAEFLEARSEERTAFAEFLRRRSGVCG